jgi:hypothetical protein
MNSLTRNRFVAAAILVLFAVCAILPLPSTSEAQAKKAGSVSVPVTGTPVGGGSFVGALDIQHFAVQGSQIVAVGTLTGTLRNAAGVVVGSVVRTVALPVNSAVTQAACEILHLELGPLDLDLLGLVVHLDRVVLDITAQPGAGNLLGNLLCAIANLLNGGGPLANIVNLLNQILDVLSNV